jgi:hypothetical protein
LGDVGRIEAAAILRGEPGVDVPLDHRPVPDEEVLHRRGITLNRGLDEPLFVWVGRHEKNSGGRRAPRGHCVVFKSGRSAPLAPQAMTRETSRPIIGSAIFAVQREAIRKRGRAAPTLVMHLDLPTDWEVRPCFRLASKGLTLCPADAQHDWNTVRLTLADDALVAIFGRLPSPLPFQPDVDGLLIRAVTAAEKFQLLGPHFFHPAAEVRRTAIRRCVDVDAYGFNLLLTLALLDPDPRARRYAALALWSRMGESGCEYAVRTIRHWCDHAAAAPLAVLTRDEALATLRGLAQAAPSRRHAEWLEHQIRRSFGESSSIDALN